MKREPLGNEQDQDRWLGNSLRQAATPPSEACPDAETLAAWAEGGLNAQAAAAVELHASNCARCLAVAAAMERSAPAVLASRAWTPSRVVRWLIPLTAAATAVAIWVVVPQRSVVEDLKTTAPVEERAAAVPVPAPVPGSGSAADSARGAVTGSAGARPEFAPELRTQSQNPAPRTLNQEPQLQEQRQFRDDDLRRERAALPAQGLAVDAPAAAPEAALAAPPAAPPPTTAAPTAQPAPPTAQGAAAAAADATAAKPTAEAPPSLSANTFSETVTTAQRSAFTTKFAVTAEAKVPKNELIQWRVIASAMIERSLDGGKTWTRTVPLPRDSVKGLTITGIRAMSDQMAIVQMSNGGEFLTSNGGISWIQVQEK